MPEGQIPPKQLPGSLVIEGLPIRTKQQQDYVEEGAGAGPETVFGCPTAQLAQDSYNYNRACPHASPSRKSDPGVRTPVEFFLASIQQHQNGGKKAIDKFS